MLLSELPREIIEKITERLCLKDKISCSLVCESWKDVFQDSLHSDLAVYSRQLKDIVNPPKDDQPPYLKNRLLVRYLEIGYYTLRTDEDLYLLQKIFPNIKYLYLEENDAILNKVGATADWNIWRSLTELYINFDKPSADINNKLIKIILCLPLLRRLQIITSSRNDIRISFSLDDFETIHSNLNHLGYLELCTSLLTLSETDIECMTNVSPATNMRNLKVYSEDTDHRWLCYFAHKYPGLHTLDLSTLKIQPEIDEKRSDTITLFQQVPLPFQRLTTLNFDYSDLVGNEYILFWDILYFYDIPLKHLSIKVGIPRYTTSSIDPRNIPKHATEVCLPRLSKTIESFRLICPPTHVDRNNFAAINCTLYNLAELYMDTCTSCEIDTLLCAAPRLRTIKLHHSDIKLKDELYNSNRFGLQSFKAVYTSLTSDVLRFLSFHCRSLNELTLMNTPVYGRFTTPGRQFIDMTYTRLEKMYMRISNFIIQDEKRCEATNRILITRPIDDIPPKQDYDPNTLPVVVDQPVAFHFDLVSTDDNDKMWIISTDKTSTYQEFVSDHEENKITTKDITNCVNTRNIEDDSWRYHSYYNYTKIELGYVSNFEVHYAYDEDVY